MPTSQNGLSMIDEGASGDPEQLICSFWIASGIDSRRWREMAYERQVAPVDVLDSVRFSGSRNSLNISALSPSGNAFEECVAKFASILSSEIQRYVPVKISRQALRADPGSLSAYRINSLVLAKSGHDWKSANNRNWQRVYVTRKFSEMISDYAQEWGFNAAPLSCAVADLGDTLSVRDPVRKSRAGGGNSTVLVVRHADVIVAGNLRGQWSMGPLRGAGFGAVRSRPFSGLVVSREVQVQLLS